MINPMIYIDNPDLDEVLMLSAMADVRAGAKIYPTELKREFPSLLTVKQPAMIGAFSWTAADGSWRWLKEDVAIPMWGRYLTPADIARDYVRAKYNGKKSRLTTAQYEATVQVKRSAPLHAIPGKYPDSVYIDLKSAYWSIVQVIGWDVDYFPGRWLGVNSSCADFPFWKLKIARNCIVSTSLAGDTLRWTGEQIQTVRKSNPLTNYLLWSAVMDTLHGVASDMVNRAGAFYVHTDGYITTQARVRDAFDVLSEWGLVGTIRKDGDAVIYSTGTYDIGDKKSARKVVREGKAFSSINPEFSDWLRPKFSKFSHRLTLKLA